MATRMRISVGLFHSIPYQNFILHQHLFPPWTSCRDLPRNGLSLGTGRTRQPCLIYICSDVFFWGQHISSTQHLLLQMSFVLVCPFAFANWKGKLKCFLITFWDVNFFDSAVCWQRSMKTRSFGVCSMGFQLGVSWNKGIDGKPRQYLITTLDSSLYCFSWTN